MSVGKLFRNFGLKFITKRHIFDFMSYIMSQLKNLCLLVYAFGIISSKQFSATVTVPLRFSAVQILRDTLSRTGL